MFNLFVGWAPTAACLPGAVPVCSHYLACQFWQNQTAAGAGRSFIDRCVAFHMTSLYCHSCNNCKYVHHPCQVMFRWNGWHLWMVQHWQYCIICYFTRKSLMPKPVPHDTLLAMLFYCRCVHNVLYWWRYYQRVIFLIWVVRNLPTN